MIREHAPARPPVMPVPSLLPCVPQLSVYVHWPFCVSLCPYCDFNRYLQPEDPPSVEQWRQAYGDELRAWRHHTGPRRVESVYFGGGTPSLMAPALVEAILQDIADLWGTTPEHIPEITLEMNPTSVETQKLQAFRQAGINRASLGVQSLRPEGLALLGRRHSVQEARQAITLAQKIFPRVSFDLMYGHEHHQDTAVWYSELEAALDLAPQHLSLYHLTYEPGTPFHRQLQQGHRCLLPEEVSALLYEGTTERMIAWGLRPYEISNYGKEGHEGRHNLAYWRYHDYLGIGPGAHGRLRPASTQVSPDAPKWVIENERLPHKWMEAVASTGRGTQRVEMLTAEQHAREVLLMGLRLAEGLPFQRVCLADRSLSAAFLRRTSILVEAGLVVVQGRTLSVSGKGSLVLNEILQYLCAEGVLENEP